MLTLGDGADEIIFSGNYAPQQVTVISDFAPASDRLTTSWATLQRSWPGGGNPFGKGFARLVQSGADTLLEFDSDGGANSFTPLIRFANTQVAAFGASNFGGFAPDNSVPAGQVVVGTAASDTITGGDVIGDFEVGADKIRLIGLGLNNFAQVQTALVEVGGTTAINLFAGDFLVIAGVANAALTANDFIFG